MEELKKLKFKNTGRGTHRTKTGKIIKPNEVFFAYEYDIPKAFRDTIKRVGEPEQVETVLEEDVPKKPERKEIQEKESVNQEYRVHDKGKGWFDVLDSNDKPINEKSLREDKAQELLKSLN